MGKGQCSWNIDSSEKVMEYRQVILDFTQRQWEPIKGFTKKNCQFVLTNICLPSVFWGIGFKKEENRETYRTSMYFFR
jgi:hypothetical protein